MKNLLRYVASPDLWQLLGLRHVSRGLPWPPWPFMEWKKSDTELTALKSGRVHLSFKVHAILVFACSNFKNSFMVFHALRNITAECIIFRTLVWLVWLIWYSDDLVWTMNMCLPGFKLLWAMYKMLSDRCGSLWLFPPPLTSFFHFF